jgi:tRNA G46 methylase TrmB
MGVLFIRAFPLLFSLGGEMSLRTNWKVYADEFCMAIALGQKIISKEELVPLGVKLIKPSQPLTLFEKKYQESGQPLYECKIRL